MRGVVEMSEQMGTVVKRIECVYLPATNMEESAKWYIEHLGLKLLRPVHENQAQLGISTEQTIFLIKSKEPGNVNYIEINGSEQCILTMEVENFRELHSKMKQNGAYVTDISDNAGCGLNFYAYDPAGNKIDIWGGWPK
jgi:catechol-2,3-dioxygenase